MHYIKFLLVIIFILNTLRLFPQNTRVEIKNISSSFDTCCIYVKYDLLKSSAKEKYKTAVLFDTKNGIINPKSISGDVGSFLKGGKNKTIKWNVLEDDLEIIGEVTPKIQIVDYNEKIGGPFNSIYSLLIPGLGDYKVRKNADIRKGFYKPYFTTILTYGIAGYGVYQKFRSDKYYKKYLDTWSQSEIDEFYKKSNNSHKQYLIAVGTAAVIWIADISYVFIKGIINKKKMKKKSAQASGNFLMNYDTKSLQADYYYKF